jgi:hypothetical protein
MKRLLYLLILFVPLLASAQTTKRIDSLLTKRIIGDSISSANLSTHSAAGKGEFQFRGSAGVFYEWYNGRRRLDSAANVNQGAFLSDTTKFALVAHTHSRLTPFAVYNYASADSFWIFEVPEAMTLDSLRVLRVGGTSAVVNAKRDRGGSVVDLLSSNYTTTTSMAKPSGLQNTSLVAGDMIYFTIRSISGTATSINIQFNYH